MDLIVEGSGRAVLLIGGCPTPGSHFDELSEHLAKDHRVVRIDLPGYGCTAPIQGKCSVGLVNGMIEDALRMVGVADLDVVGVSFGAYRALLLALSRRVRVRTIVSLGGIADFAPDERAALLGFADAVSAGVDLRAALVQRMLSPAFAGARPDACAYVRTWLDAISRDALVAELRCIAECPSLRPRLGSLDSRVVARVGALDVAAPIACSEAIVSDVQSAELQVVDGSGHLLLLEDGTATFAAIDRALAKGHFVGSAQQRKPVE